MTDDHVQLLRSELGEMLRKASHDGAREALKEIGLADEDAMKDWRDFRELMKTFRFAKKTMLKAAIRKLVDFVFMLLLLGVAAKFGIKMVGG